MSRPTITDLFAGAGGFGLGFRLAGFDVTCSLEIDEWACQTLQTNNPSMQVIMADIKEFKTASEIRAACHDSPDVIIGGPPCQGFSIAGSNHTDLKDPRNSLFREFAHWVESLNPRVFLMENVKGLLTRKNADGEKVIDIITRTFAKLGYSVEVWTLNAAEYGVPQLRERVFVVGNKISSKTTLGIPPRTHVIWDSGEQTQQVRLASGGLKPAVTLWDAISDLPQLGAGEGSEEQPYTSSPNSNYERWARNGQSVLWNHVAMQHSERLVERFKHVKWGESSSTVPAEHRALKRNGNGVISKEMYDQNNRRLHPYRPSHTIAASFYANFIHPFQNRNLTAREGARIQSFPDNYRFMGKKTVVSHKLLQRERRFSERHLCQYNQIGNAVPPLLAKVIGEHVMRCIS
jgi:DNA (cytosine-5)-methyltransferase 1